MNSEEINYSLKRWDTALKTLANILDEPESDIVRDATIKRFEYCYELTWKTLRRFLLVQGVECNSPKQTFKSSLKEGFIDDDSLWIDMLNDRNLTTHTYDEIIAETIFDHIPRYYSQMVTLYNKMSSQF